MFFKKIFAVLISGILLCTSLTAPAYAETTSSYVDSGISPAYEITAEVAVTGNPSWPENDIITGYTIVSGEKTYQLEYLDRYSNKRPSDWIVYLLGRTRGGVVQFSGDWQP